MTLPRIAIIAGNLPEAGPATTGSGVAVRLAAMLRKAGQDVELCFAWSSAAPSGAMALRRSLGRLGVRLACLYLPQGDYMRASLGVLNWLKAASVHLAVFVDSAELGYWPAMARKTRVGLLGTKLATLILAPPEAGRASEGRFVGGPEDILREDISRIVAQASDLVATLNPTAKAWADSALAGLAETRRVDLPCPPLALISAGGPEAPRSAASGQPTRLVLCGAVSIQGGVERSIALIERLGTSWPAGLSREIAMVGRWHCLPNGESAALVAHRVAADIGVALRWIEPSDYVTDVQSGRTANDVALFIEKGPAGFDLLAALVAAGGLSRIVSDGCYAAMFEPSANALLVEAEPAALAAACAGPALDGATRAAVRTSLEASARRANEVLLSALAEVATTKPLQPFESARKPRVSVCISHFNRPDLLDQAIRSLEAQDYPNLEVVVVDDASPSAEAKAYIAALTEKARERNWIVLRNQTEQWQQESRNIAAQHATGDYVLIMDDDNCARPDEVSTMVTVAEGLGYPIVRCLQGIFEGDSYPAQASDEARVDFFPTGGPLSVGTMWNVFGDVNVLFRRETFLSLGGFGKTEGLGCEDFEIGIRAAMAGIDAVTIPRVLYDYRMSAVNMAKSMNNKRLYDSHARLSALYEAAVPAPVAPVFRLLNQNFHRSWQRDGGAYWARPLPPPESFRARVLKVCPLEAEGLLYLAGILAEEGALADAESLTRFLHKSFPQELRVNALMHRILLMRGKVSELRQWQANLGEAFAHEDKINIAAADAALSSDA